MWRAVAWHEVSKNSEMVVRSFKKCGITLNQDGRENDQVNIKGIENYEFPTTDQIQEFSLNTDDDFSDEFTHGSDDGEEEKERFFFTS